MIPVRHQTPNRQNITTIVKHWRDHKKTLQVDFHRHCAYCGSYDGFRHTYYEVDHFIPKSFFAPLGNITPTQYNNLIYACKFCNNNKSDKWPSQSETIYHNGLEGFVDPCSDEYDQHLYRTPDGAIMWKTLLGKWMHNTAFKFDERERALQLLWNLNKLRRIIKRLQSIKSQFLAGTELYQDIDDRIRSYSVTFVQFHGELSDYYN